MPSPDHVMGHSNIFDLENVCASFAETSQILVLFINISGQNNSTVTPFSQHIDEDKECDAARS